ncbi:MAG: hypothetical protein NC900_01860 [Candidatus Omnitrophica bacterium]|nr:hypothetical protein [Candidatus Omnitrophota bacterium]
MRRVILSILILIFICNLSYSKEGSFKIILLITEQNISGPQRAWWASEIDLSVTEATIAKNLIEKGYKVLEPSVLNKVILQDKAFRMVNISEEKTKKLAKLAKADYVILGKAIASRGGSVPQSNMQSCFANITTKLIRIKDGKVIAYLDSSGSSAHLDIITGGKEALINAAEDLSNKIVYALGKEGETK